jgi:SH3-like domain-containing protein
MTRLILILSLAALACASPAWVPTATPTPLPAPTPTKPTLTGAWTAKIELPTVNVRKTPGGEVIDSLSAGETVTIIQCTGSWCQISKPAGWVWRGCLSDNPERLGCQAK